MVRDVRLALPLSDRAVPRDRQCHFTRSYVSDGWTGKLFLEGVFALQQIAPTYCGRYGQMPAIILRKDLQLSRNSMSRSVAIRSLATLPRIMRTDAQSNLKQLVRQNSASPPDGRIRGQVGPTGTIHGTADANARRRPVSLTGCGAAGTAGTIKVEPSAASFARPAFDCGFSGLPGSGASPPAETFPSGEGAVDVCAEAFEIRSRLSNAAVVTIRIGALLARITRNASRINRFRPARYRQPP